MTKVGTSELLQVLREVRLGEGHDAIIVRLDTAHHALAPPIPNHTRGCFRAWPLVTVKGSGRQIQIKLRPVGGHLRLKAVEYFLRQAAGIRRSLYHQWRHCANEDSLGDATFAVTRDVMCDLPAAGRVAYMDGIL